MSRIRLHITIAAMTICLAASCGGEAPPAPVSRGTTPVAADPPQADADSTQARTKRKYLDVPINGLDWLAQHQSADGGWADDGGVEATTTDDPQLTGITAYAFVAGGFTHRGRRAENRAVGAALRFIKQHQGTDGKIAPHAGTATLHDHAPGAAALIDAYALTGSRVYLKPAQGALDHLARECRGGRVREVDVVGWTLLALMTARAIHRHASTREEFEALTFDESAFDSLHGWAEVTRSAGHGRCAIAGLARIAFDPLDSAEARLGEVAESLLRRPFAWDAADGNTDPLASLFASVALQFVSYKLKSRWQQATARALSSAQMDEGGDPSMRGSWPPDRLSDFSGGRVRMTALCTLIEGLTWNPYSLPRIEDFR